MISCPAWCMADAFVGQVVRGTLWVRPIGNLIGNRPAGSTYNASRPKGGCRQDCLPHNQGGSRDAA